MWAGDCGGHRDGGCVWNAWPPQLRRGARRLENAAIAGAKHLQNAAIERYVLNSGILPLYRVEAVTSDFDAAKPDVPLFRAPLYQATYCIYFPFCPGKIGKTTSVGIEPRTFFVSL